LVTAKVASKTPRSPIVFNLNDDDDEEEEEEEEEEKEEEDE
jgi:hypothetical protein